MQTSARLGLAVALLGGFMACGDNDDDDSFIGQNDNTGSDNNNDTTGNPGGSNNNSDGSNGSAGIERDIVINEVFYRGDASSDYIELKNVGDDVVDLTSYRFCLRVGVYPALDGLETFGPAELLLAPNELITFRAPEDLGESGTIALYDRGGAFTDPDALIDFVQWGAATVANSRADIAVLAEQWTQTDDGFAFVPGALPNQALAFDGTEGDVPEADYRNTVPSPSFEDGVMDIATRVDLSVANTVPPATTTSSAGGEALVTVGPDWVVVLGQVADLSSALLDIGDVGPVHLHLALPEPEQAVTEATGPVAYPLIVDAAADRRSADISLRTRLEDDLLEPEVAPSDRPMAFRDGRYYINVHTEANATGELRGQVDFGTTPDPTSEVRKVVINEVFYGGDQTADYIELKNVGNVTVDLTGWFFCYRIGAYPALSGLTIIGGSDDLLLLPGELIVFAAGQNLANESGAVALYANNSNFGSPANMRDYVRYGSGTATNERADIAVAAGLWTEAPGGFDFVPTAGEAQALILTGDPLVEPSTSDLFANGIANPGQDNDEPPTAARRIIIHEVFHGGDRFVDYIELKNLGDRPVNLESFVFCLRVGVYPGLTTLPIFGDGDFVLDPDEVLVVRAPEDLGAAATIALYWRGGGFANPDNMADFVQYGAATIANTRATEAIAAGLWTEVDGAPDFVPAAPAGRSLSLIGGFDRLETTSADWGDRALSFGQDNEVNGVSSILRLSPDNTVPPAAVPSAAEGALIAAHSDGILSVIGSFEGLTSGLLPIPDIGPAHVHLSVREPTQAFEAATGPVAYALTVVTVGAPTAAVVFGRFDLALDTLLEPQLAPVDPALALLQGQFYVNIHTEQNNSGELRTQLVFDEDTAAPDGLPRDIALNEVRYAGDADNDFMELINAGPGTVDISDWQFCFRAGAYASVSSLTILSGNADLILEPGEIIAFRAPIDLDDTAAGLSIYVDNAFTSPQSIVDFVKWGDSAIPGTRADVAVDAGIWPSTSDTEVEFVSTTAANESLGYGGTNAGPGILTRATDWSNGPPDTRIRQLTRMLGRPTVAVSAMNAPPGDHPETSKTPSTSGRIVTDGRRRTPPRSYQSGSIEPLGAEIIDSLHQAGELPFAKPVLQAHQARFRDGRRLSAVRQSHVVSKPSEVGRLSNLVGVRPHRFAQPYWL